MDNVVNLKRKAQKLVQKGSYDEAIKTYGSIAESGHMDPYDFVVLGDLLLRMDRKDDAIDRYQEALDSYVQGGLHRNAIALCKRIKRLVPEKLPVLRHLADLYAAEGLNTEASLHYIEYLEKAKDQPDFGEAAEEICVRLLGFPLPTFDLVPRIVAIAEEVDRGTAVAPGVLFQAQRAAEAGREQLASDFRELASRLDPEAAAAAEPEPAPAPVMDPGAVTLDEGTVGEEPAVLSLDEDLPANAPPTPAGTATEETLSVGEIDLGPLEDEAPMEMVEPADSMHTPVGEGSALRERADRSLAKGESVLAQREYLRSAQAFLAEGDDSQAEEVYLQVVRLDPNHIDALESLVDIADRSGDATKVARYGCDLGDVLLARDRYEEALERFRHVIDSDPENAKARSRIKRLESMMGGGESEEPARRGAGVVEVRDEAAAPTQTSLDLSAILDEFRASIVDSIPESDAQSHYDMGMAYREMGLLDEALIEYQTASANESLRWSALEMMAECYLQLGRPQDTLQILEELLAGVTDPVIGSRIHLAVGKAREALGHAAEAEASYCHALELNEDLAEATERLNAMDQRRAGGMG